MHLQFAGRRRGVNAFRQTDKRDSQRLQLVEERDQVFQIAPEPIEPPADQDVEPAAPGVRNQLVERRPPILRTGDTPIDVLNGRPVPSLRVAPELLKLILRLLLES
jgi:hypothetical protein